MGMQFGKFKLLLAGLGGRRLAADLALLASQQVADVLAVTPHEQRAESSEMIRARGEALGFEFGSRDRIYNTFDAHRLLHWAELEGKQHELKMALFNACFTAGENVSAHDVLVRLAGQVGLDQAEAKKILVGDTYGAEVREREQFFQRHGINSVPAIIINQKHLISGGQPPEVFEQAIRDIAAKE